MMTTHLRRPITTLMAALALALLVGCGRQGSPTNPTSVGLHEAVAEGNLEAVRQHIAAGSDLNARDPMGGSSPLIAAAVFGNSEAARTLVKAGADVDFSDNEGSTPLICAAFFCHTEIVETLLANGADKNVRNKAGSTALDSVAGPFNEVKVVYDLLGTTLGLQLDYERIQATRPQIAAMLR